MSDRSTSWWASSKAHSRRTSVAIVALGLVLATLSYVVWASPASPAHQAIAGAIEATESLNPLQDENKALKIKLASLTSKLEAKSAELDKQRRTLATAQAAGVKDLAIAKQRVAAAEQELAQAVQTADAAQDAAAKARQAAAAAVRPKPPRPAPVAGAPITAPPKADLTNPASRYFGMYTQQAPFNWATLDATSRSIGLQPNLVGFFSGWDQDFRADAVSRSWSRGIMPMVTWESRPALAANDTVSAPDYSLPRILGNPEAGVPGAFDEYIRKYARDIVASGLPIGLRFNHEMNGVWYPWSEVTGKGESINGNSKGDYVKVWKHVHDIFEAEGANALVVWVWAPNIINNLPAANQSPEFLAGLYPGDEYVDWVGLSGYLRPAYKPENNFTFDYTFGRSLDQLRGLTDKPIMLAETGASESGGHKPAWVTSFFNSLSDPKNDDVVGFAWFNLAVTSYVEGERATNDWRIDSRADSLSAFITGISKPEGNFSLLPAP